MLSWEVFLAVEIWAKFGEEGSCCIVFICFSYLITCFSIFTGKRSLCSLNIVNTFWFFRKGEIVIWRERESKRRKEEELPPPIWLLLQITSGPPMNVLYTCRTSLCWWRSGYVWDGFLVWSVCWWISHRIHLLA